MVAKAWPSHFKKARGIEATTSDNKKYKDFLLLLVQMY